MLSRARARHRVRAALLVLHWDAVMSKWATTGSAGVSPLLYRGKHRHM